MSLSEKELFQTHVSDCVEAIKAVYDLETDIFKVVDACEKTARSGGVIYAFGNGGSACEAIHLVEELVARYLMERPGIRAQHFLDGATMTCWGNDYDFIDSFKRQVETFVTEKDTVFAFSTSGNSENILRSLKSAKDLGATTVLMGGKGGGKAKALSDIPLIVEAPRTMRIQEAHMLIVHMIVHLLENRLYPEKANS